MKGFLVLPGGCTAHLVSGHGPGGEPQTFCGKGHNLNLILAGAETLEEEPVKPVCVGCERARKHAANVGNPDGLGGMAISSPRLGTGRRRY